MNRITTSFLTVAVAALGCRPALAQVSLGVKAGPPTSETSVMATSGLTRVAEFNRRYTVGGSAELRLPFRLAVSLDALYTRGGIDSVDRRPLDTQVSATRLNYWEFPLLAKYPLWKARLVTPFVASGVALQRVTGRETSLVSSPLSTERRESQTPRKVSSGFVVGAGADVGLRRFLVISPEFRYTRWHYGQPTSFDSQTNQIQFLLGVSFSK